MQIKKLLISETEPSLFEAWFDEMPNERREKAVRYAKKADRDRCIAAFHLACEMISESCGIAPYDIVFEKNEHGKPYVKNADIFFNISHSGNFVVCAVSEREIGVDIQQIKGYSEKMISRIACAEEEKYILGKLETRFFEIWTLKEAYFKCIGTGLGGNIKDVTFDINDNEIICSDPNIKCRMISLADGYVCAVCEKRN